MGRFDRRTFLGGAGAIAAGAATGAALGSTPAGASVALSQANVNAALAVLGKTSLRQPDSLPFPDRLPGTDTMPGIEHIVVLMMENHSFDNFLGTLPPQRGADGFTMDRAYITPGDAWDAKGGWNPNGVVASNPNGQGKFQWAYHMPTTCQHSGGPTQEWSASHEQFNNGKMDGFVTCVSWGAPKIAGPVGMAYWNGSDLPVLHSLAMSFALGDRYFQSVLGQTDPNRRFLFAASSAGMVDDIAVTTKPTMRDILADATLPLPANGTILDRLSAFGISWANYTDDYPLGSTPELVPTADAAVEELHYKAFADFYDDCRQGKLASFVMLDEDYSTQSQENPQDIVVGEQLIYDVVGALANSPQWNSTILIITYDEHGGYFDHVPPPVALAPDLIPPVVDVAHGQQRYGGFTRYGFRVPTLVVSPYSIPAGITHTVFDHTSILALIERKWNLPAMTYRDANANDLTDFLDLARLAKTQPRSFEEFCPVLDLPARSNVPAVAPELPPPGSVQEISA